MNWNNIDLNSPYELDQPILDSYDCNQILMEVEHNCKVINKDTVKAQAMISIKAKYDTAIEILNDNLGNLTAAALKYRAIP